MGRELDQIMEKLIFNSAISLLSMFWSSLPKFAPDFLEFIKIVFIFDGKKTKKKTQCDWKKNMITEIEP